MLLGGAPELIRLGESGPGRQAPAKKDGDVPVRPVQREDRHEDVKYGSTSIVFIYRVGTSPK